MTRQATAARALEIAVQVQLDVEFLREHWTELRQRRVPGSRRPWRQSMLDPQRRAEIAERDRLERAVRDPDAPGFTSAPMHLDVLDTLVTVWLALEDLAAEVSRTLHQPPPIPPRVQTMARLDSRALRTIDRFLLDALDAPGGAVWRIDKLAARLHRATDDVARSMRLLRAGQLLAGDPVCPWCFGATPAAPAGGELTLQVIDQPDVAIVCRNPVCDPPEADAGVRINGRPAWPLEEWDWLARKIEHAAGQWQTINAAAGVASSRASPGPVHTVPPVDHSNRAAVSVMPCPFCLYRENDWIEIGHPPLPRCTAEVCDARTHRCRHREDTRT